MGTRATVQRAVEPPAVLKRLPPRLRSCVDLGVVGADAVDLVVFEPGEGHVVTSKDLEKALAQRGDSHARLVAVGYDFTEEARMIVVEAKGGLLFSERSFFGWTDEMWHAVKQR
jgi:hypothetical protein